MEQILLYGLFAMSGAAATYQLAALFATVLFLLRRDPASAELPPVSILKPVHGLDPGFYEAIRSHAVQDYPEFEMLFGVSDPEDKAIPAIRKLQAEFPGRRIELIQCQSPAPNPKVAKLIELARHARHPLLLVNDGDILVRPEYLRSIVPPLVNSRSTMQSRSKNAQAEDSPVGLVTCLYRVSAKALPARWAAMGVATDFVPSTLVAPLVGVKEFALGSTLLFRADDLQRIGGYAALANHLVDDYQLAKRITALGLRVHLSCEVVQTSLQDTSWAGIWRHQVRWQRMIRVSRGDGYLGLPFTFATLWALVALLAGQPWVAAALLVLRMAMAMTAGLGALRCPVTARLWPLVPLRDLWGVAVWTAALFGRTIHWRGDVLRLAREGKIVS